MRALVATSAAVVAVSLGVYWNSLTGAFVYDDPYQVVENPWITDVGYLDEIFTQDFWGFHESATSHFYRPMHHVVYMATYRVFGLDPWGFHLVNLLLHAGVSVLVLWVAWALPGREAGRGPGGLIPPLLAALIFAVHPVHTEVVAWIGGAPDLAASAFFLTALLLYARATRDPERARAGLFVGSLVSFALAALSKEVALSFPLVLIAYEVAFAPTPSLPWLGRAVRRVAPFFAVAGAYAGLRMWVLGSFAGEPTGAPLSLEAFAANGVLFLGGYLRLLLLPVELNAFHASPLVESFSAISDPWAVALSVGFAAAGLLALRARGAPLFALALLLLPLLPALYFPALPINKFSERYLYLPSAGFALLVGLGLGAAQPRGRGVFAALVAVAVAAIGAGAIRTVARNPVWKDDLSLWSDVIEKSPAEVGPNYNLGIALLDAQRTDEAIARFQRTIELAPDHKGAYINLGVASLRTGDMERAAEAYRLAVALDPGDPRARVNLGFAYARLGRAEEAIAEADHALAVAPDAPEIRASAATVYGAAGHLEEARRQYQMALAATPDDVSLRLRLATLLVRLGDAAAARREIELVLARDPANPRARQLRRRLSRAGSP